MRRGTIKDGGIALGGGAAARGMAHLGVLKTLERNGIIVDMRPRYKTPSIMQTIMRGYVVQNVNMNSIGVQPADMMIDADVTQFDLSAFTRTAELAAVGAQQTESTLASIRSMFAKLDNRLFSAEARSRNWSPAV